MTPEDLSARLDTAVAGAGGLPAVLTEIDQAVFDEARFDDKLFDHLLYTLRSPLLLDHRDALSLVKLFEEQGTLLQPAQRAQLVQALPAFVLGVRDEIAAFLAVEVWVTLAEPERSAFDGLQQLHGHVAPPRLTVLVHGYDWLCKQSGDARLRDLCLAVLKKLQGHGDAAVAAEAGAAVARRTKQAR